MVSGERDLSHKIAANMLAGTRRVRYSVMWDLAGIEGDERHVRKTAVVPVASWIDRSFDVHGADCLRVRLLAVHRQASYPHGAMMLPMGPTLQIPTMRVLLPRVA